MSYNQCMRRRRDILCLCSILFPLLAGCTRPAEPAIYLATAGVAPSPDVSALASVLNAAVTPDGSVRLPELVKTQDDLQRQLRLFAVTGPSATPGQFGVSEQVVAYWYNVRMAWSLELARRAECEKADPTLLRRTSFPVDGRRMSVDCIDELLVGLSRQEGDFRIAACAPGAWLDDAPLPNRPFVAADLFTRQQEMLNRLVLNEKHFVISIEQQSVYVPSLLWRVRDVLLAEYTRQYGPGGTVVVALKSWLSPLACVRLENALGYRVVEQSARDALAIQGRMMYMPGNIGKVEVD